MEDKEMLIKYGYWAALICFFASFVFSYSNKEYQNIFLGIGGVLLFVTSLYKIRLKNKNPSIDTDKQIQYIMSKDDKKYGK